MDTIGIQVGASPEAVMEARRAVLDILNATVGGRTMRKALDVFALVCEVRGTVVTGNTVSMGVLPEPEATITGS